LDVIRQHERHVGGKEIPASLRRRRRRRDGIGCSRVAWRWSNFTQGTHLIEFSRHCSFLPTPLISHPGMTSPSNEARLQLRDARDALCVSQLFANHPFTADDATNALEDSHVTPDPALIRVLLQHGADVNALSIRKVTWSKHPTELLRLLAEYGYDFKPYSHCILQSVASPGSH
jgi:hypothetical protein